MESVEHLYQKRLTDLEELDKKCQPDPFHGDRRVARIQSLLEGLKREIPQYSFADEGDDIYFSRDGFLLFFHSISITRKNPRWEVRLTF